MVYLFKANWRYPSYSNQSLLGSNRVMTIQKYTWLQFFGENLWLVLKTKEYTSVLFYLWRNTHSADRPLYPCWGAPNFHGFGFLWGRPERSPHPRRNHHDAYDFLHHEVWRQCHIPKKIGLSLCNINWEAFILCSLISWNLSYCLFSQLMASNKMQGDFWHQCLIQMLYFFTWYYAFFLHGSHTWE